MGGSEQSVVKEWDSALSCRAGRGAWWSPLRPSRLLPRPVLLGLQRVTLGPGLGPNAHYLEPMSIRTPAPFFQDGLQEEKLASSHLCDLRHVTGPH